MHKRHLFAFTSWILDRASVRLGSFMEIFPSASKINRTLECVVYEIENCQISAKKFYMHQLDFPAHFPFLFKW